MPYHHQDLSDDYYQKAMMTAGEARYHHHHLHHLEHAPQGGVGAAGGAAQPLLGQHGGQGQGQLLDPREEALRGVVY